MMFALWAIGIHVIVCTVLWHKTISHLKQPWRPLQIALLSEPDAFDDEGNRWRRRTLAYHRFGSLALLAVLLLLW